ncbi:MAG: ribosome maturation factor RimP [Ruminococcaceae bacterium]|nr:ribosome maturation factor RimP [Oscillospiraceae bacterium]
MSEEIKAKKKTTVEIVTELALPIAEKLGLDLWDVNYVKEGTEWYLRIFIDKVSGVDINDCVDMTHKINPILDEVDPIKGEYTLEVSSPGINRKLTKKEHFEKFLEAPVRVKLVRPLEDGRREIEGILIDVFDNGDFEVIIEEDTTVTFTKKECSSVILLDDDFDNFSDDEE